MYRSGRAILSLILGISLVAGACGSDSGDTAATATTAAPAAPAATAAPETTAASAGETTAASAGELAGVCPATVVIQTDWFPESEHGGMYEMVGDD
ncbi:MAG TPA: hypothetical protein EYG32_07880, partial [Acidimicrobiia bacterium]|nr:hypothetical protein [Acidimicrobiia bacterium]